MHLLLDKAVKISVSTAEPIIKKDFSLEPEEDHMRIAARNMVANMSSRMMLITGKKPLTSRLYTVDEIYVHYENALNMLRNVIAQWTLYEFDDLMIAIHDFKVGFFKYFFYKKKETEKSLNYFFLLI
jgi:hypothetical protein